MQTDHAIRRANQDDLGQLLAMNRAYCQLDGHDFNQGKTAEAFMPLLADDRFGVVWVAGEPACAYAVVTWGYSVESGGVDALVDEIYVENRNQGIGTRLMEWAIKDVQDRGINRMFLETEVHNERARQLYSRFGFSIEPSIWMARETEG